MAIMWNLRASAHVVYILLYQFYIPSLALQDLIVLLVIVELYALLNKNYFYLASLALIIRDFPVYRSLSLPRDQEKQAC